MNDHTPAGPGDLTGGTAVVAGAGSGISGDNRNVAVVRRFLDQVVNGGRPELIDELWAPDLVWHGGSLGEMRGIDDYLNVMAASAGRAFDGMRLTIHEVIAAGDRVVVRFTNTGTQAGPFLGTPATGKRAEWLGIGIYTIRAGKIAEAWFAEDILAMLLQLGSFTLPA
jgi:predicted ester cyclase